MPPATRRSDRRTPFREGLSGRLATVRIALWSVTLGPPCAEAPGEGCPTRQGRQATQRHHDVEHRRSATIIAWSPACGGRLHWRDGGGGGRHRRRGRRGRRGSRRGG